VLLAQFAHGLFGNRIASREPVALVASCGLCRAL
jgi:hypothetical protein